MTDGASGEQVYIDIGFVRIQRYLARTAKLRGRRSASAEMAEVTDSAAIAAQLPHGLATENDEAGSADGIVNLKLTDPRPDGRKERVEQAITAVLSRLREEFPAAELQAVWGVGESYVSAYVQQIGPRTQRGEVWHDLPALPEFPAVRLCALCVTDPATERAWLPEKSEKPQSVCADCARRLRRRAGTGNRSAQKSAEHKLQALTKLSEAPDALEDLAAFGASDTKLNHLATIYVDGNSVGQFFRRLVAAASAQPELHELKKNLSRKLSEITEGSLQYATLEVANAIELEYTGPLPVVPHVVGGDDVLVSLPASYAWEFVVKYLQYFGELIGSLVQGINDKHHLNLPTPSASAGIIFAQRSEPMYLLVDLAEERLRAAKRATRGRASSVDFLDLTTDGPHGVEDPPLPLSVLAKPETLDALDRLSRLNQSNRVRLAQDIRHHGDEVSAESLARRASTIKTVRPFLTGRDGLPPRSGISLRHALRIVNWWLPMGPTAWSAL